MNNILSSIQTLKSSEDCGKFSKRFLHKNLVGGTATTGTGRKQTLRLGECCAHKPLSAVGTFSAFNNTEKVVEKWLQISPIFRLVKIVSLVAVLSTGFVGEVRADAEDNTSTVIGGDNCGTNCHWEINNGVLSISAINPNEPATMSDYARVSSALPWISYKEQISGVNVNDVTNIGNSAFEDMTNISSISIGESVETIGDYAFNKNKLSQVIIPDNVQQVGVGAFLNQREIIDGEKQYTLTYVELPKGVGLAKTAFDNHLTTISIPDSLTAEKVASWSGAAFGYGNAERYITNIECRGEDGQPGDDSKCYAALAGKFIRDENGRCSATDLVWPTCLNLVQKVGQTCLNNKLNKEGECIESSACTGEYLISGNQCIKMPGCVDYADGACGGCENGYYKKDNGCVSAQEGCGSGYLEKDSVCISSANGCGAGYKDMGGWCNRIRYTPAEAAPLLNDDDNTVTITFRK